MKKITLTIAVVILLASMAMALPKNRLVIDPGGRAIDTLTFIDKLGFRVLVITEIGKLPILKVDLP